VEHKNGVLLGEVLHVDGFGNVITNIPRKQILLFEKLKVNLHHATLQLVLAETYAQTKLHEPIALIGSHGFLELALNQGSFAEKFRVNTGDKVEVSVV
jgi:S-adenosyl-L-methionine hydrolase (adenosine-forming)